jgi:hypothetical protein
MLLMILDSVGWFCACVGLLFSCNVLMRSAAIFLYTTLSVLGEAGYGCLFLELVFGSSL